MYKIKNITDLDGYVKVETFYELKQQHPEMTGTLLFHLSAEIIKAYPQPMCFVWSDDEEHMMRTSAVKEWIETGNEVKVVTQNTIYWLRKVG